MRKMKKRSYGSNPFGAMQGAAVGMAGLGVVSAVTAGIQAQAPAGTPNMMGGFSTIASFTPIAATTTIGRSLLPKRKKSYGF
jgi:hypothetical protein